MTDAGPRAEAQGPGSARPPRRAARPKVRLVAGLVALVLFAMAVAWATAWTLTADAIARSRGLAAQGMPRAAAAELERALGVRPGDRGLALELARIRATTGDAHGAIEMYRIVLTSGPDGAVSYALAMVERLAGRTGDVERDLAIAAASDPSNAVYADEHAKTLLELGRESAALAVWRRVAADSSQTAQVRRDMRLRVARVLLDAGERAGARSEARAALKLLPGDPQATAILGLAR